MVCLKVSYNRIKHGLKYKVEGGKKKSVEGANEKMAKEYSTQR